MKRRLLLLSLLVSLGAWGQRNPETAGASDEIMPEKYTWP